MSDVDDDIVELATSGATGDLFRPVRSRPGGPVRSERGRHTTRWSAVTHDAPLQLRRRRGGGGGGGGGEFVDDDDEGWVDVEEEEDAARRSERPSANLRRLFADIPPAAAAPEVPIPTVIVDEDNGGGDDDPEPPSNTSIDGATRTTFRRTGAAADAPEYRSLTWANERRKEQVLSEARVRLARASEWQHRTQSRGTICYLCRYGHRGVDAATGRGAQLHGMLQQIISQNLATAGADETTTMAHRYFTEHIKPAFERAGIAVPIFDPAEVYVHLSTIAHSKNSRLFMGWAVDRLGAAAELLWSEAYELGKGTNVAKCREARMTVRDMKTFYHTDPRQLLYGEPTPADIMPDLTSRTMRASLLTGTDTSHLPRFLFDEGEEEEDDADPDDD